MGRALARSRGGLLENFARWACRPARHWPAAIKRNGCLKSRGPVRKCQPSFEARWRERFEAFGKNGKDDAAIAGWSATGLATRLRNFALVWNADRPGALWLDAGCGAGTYSRFMVGRGLRVVAMDYSEPTIVKARARSAAPISWCIADVNRLPVCSRSVDGAICFGVLQALTGSERAVRELARTVKVDGEVWFDALNAWCLPNVWDHVARRVSGKPMHLRYESGMGLKRLMRESGLAGVRLNWLPILPARWQRFQWLLETKSVRALFRYVPLLGLFFSHAFVVSGRKF